MPDKTPVSVMLRIVRDGGSQEFALNGELHRLATGSGWAIVVRGGADMTLIVRPDEIRVTRKGEVSQDQRFRPGHWLPGTIGTAHGLLPVEAWTHRLQAYLTAAGGAVEWEYEMRMTDQELGRCAVMLHIREEQTE